LTTGATPYIIRSPDKRGRAMLIFFLIIALIFLISGGIGLFYTNTTVEAWSTLWVFGNLTFGVFALFGLAVIIFLAIFNAEFD
jgi:hypothetical protein